MKKTIVLVLAVFFAGTGPCYAADVQMGTWELNEAKSKLNPGAAKVTRAIYTPVGDRVKITVNGIDKEGKPTHDEWVGKLDGKDYPVTGDPRSDMRSYATIDDRTLELTVKRAGNVLTNGFIVISADGKNRTTIAIASDPSGKKVPYIAVYDKR